MRHLMRLVALALAAGALLGATPAHAEEVVLRVRLWTTPTSAARGDIVKYEIMLDNIGDARASRARVTLPLSPHMTVVRTDFDNAATWISALSEDELTVMFGRMKAGESRRAAIYVQIGPDAPDGLQVRARASARHEGDSGREHSNTTTLTIGGQDADAAPSATLEAASVPKGARLALRVRNYFPGERVTTWINGPNGVIETKVAATSGGAGEADMTVGTNELAPGAYSLVVYGASSAITIVIPFTVTPQ